jgi:hypothetical protein
MRGRAYRRHQLQRVKRLVRGYYGAAPCPEGIRADPRRLGRLARTRTPCSCWMCGNPRRYWRELTLQEQRSYLSR